MQSDEEYSAVLNSIVHDMHCWPQNLGTFLRSVDLLAVGPDYSGTLSLAVVLVHSKDNQEGPWWTLIRLHRRHVPYFKRAVWFYVNVPDGPKSPYLGYRDEPSIAEVKDFIRESSGSLLETKMRWANGAQSA